MPWLQLSECHFLEGVWKNEYNDFYTQRKGITQVYNSLAIESER
jgi:hypothetical protein